MNNRSRLPVVTMQVTGTGPDFTVAVRRGRQMSNVRYVAVSETLMGAEGSKADVLCALVHELSAALRELQAPRKARGGAPP